MAEAGLEGRQAGVIYKVVIVSEAWFSRVRKRGIGEIVGF